LQQRDLAIDGGEVLVVHVGDRLRRVELLAAAGKPLHQHVREHGKVGKFLRAAPVRLAAETRHAVRHVGLEPDPPLLAVVRDVDAGVELPLEDVRDTVFDRGIERAAIDAFPELGTNEQIVERFAPRQAADMGHQNAVFAFPHRSLLRRGRSRSRLLI